MLIGLLMSAAANVTGQIIYGQPASGDIGFVYTHWDIEGEYNINQFAIPINGFMPLKDNLEFRFSAVNSSSNLEIFDFDFKLSGLSDVRLQLNQSLAEDKILLSLGLNLPTGKKELSFIEELPVLQTLSLNFLDFPVRQLGEGFGFNLMAGGAEMLGEIKVGGALMYQYNGAYKPYDTEDEYNPGDQFSVTGNANLSGDKHSVTLSGIYSVFGTDKQEDRKIFAQAPLFNLGLSGIFGEGTVRYGGDIGLLFRGRNARYDSTETKFEQLKAFGSEYFLGMRMYWTPDNYWKIAPLLELHIIGENEYDIEGAAVYGFGCEATRNISTGIDLGFGFKYFTGGATEFGDLDIKGYQVFGSLMTSFK
jgi:hypothetical protein